jgi:hypothetical protein
LTFFHFNQLSGILKGVNVSVGEREEMAVDGGGDDKENKRDNANSNNGNSKTKNPARYFDASTSTTGEIRLG